MKANKFGIVRALSVACMLFLGQLGPVQAGGSLQYLSPEPGTDYNPTGTTIAVRYGAQLNAQDVNNQLFTVTGSASGRHTGTVVLSDDQQTLIFKPASPFIPGETVDVTGDSWTAPGSTEPFPTVDFSFGIVPTSTMTTTSTTGQIVLQSSAPAAPNQGQPGARQYATAPEDLPPISVTVPATNTAPGYIFASNFQLDPGPSGYYLLILDNQGEPVYYQKLEATGRALDFKELPDGTLTYMDTARNTYVILDNTYHEVGTVRPGNGVQWMDEHDMQLLPNGHHLVLADEARVMDLSKVGGNAKARVTAQLVQELDKQNNVVFQWRLLDHLPITETSQSLTASNIDWSHANAVTLDLDGNILLSSRHLDEITKIDRQTGDVIWQMGGKANQFKFSAAPGIGGPVNFYHQHDVRVLPNGHITVFDNHNGQQPQVSRVLEYAVDQTAMTATLVKVDTVNPPPYAEAMGNGQLLPNGDTFIGWGTNLYPNMTEVQPDGTTNFALDFGGSNVTYRAFRFPWQGFPSWAPALVGNLSGNSLTLSTSWNGATDIASYRFYGGNTNPPNTLVSEQRKQGFETSFTVSDAANGFCFYQVMPVDRQGNTTQLSTVVENPAMANTSACQAQAELSGVGQ
jgi:hypothetical protein